MTNTTRITGADLIAQGWPQGPAIGMTLRVAQGLPNPKEEILQTLAQVLATPADYLDHKYWGEAAGALVLKMRKEAGPDPIELRSMAAPLSVWGRDMIDEKSFDQINDAAKLPVALRVALMPDAHVGYGIPIGGVVALDGAIAPYMVGVDIGCRMHATIIDRSPIHLDQDTRGYVKYLRDHTYFGRTGPKQGQENAHRDFRRSTLERTAT